VADPVWHALAQSTGACASTYSDANGDFVLYYPHSGTYDITVSHERFGVLPTIYDLATSDSITPTFVLPPADDVIQNGHFEAGDLTDWSEQGATQIASSPHSGQYAISLDGSGSFSQTTTLPGEGVLSWMDRVVLDHPSSTFQVYTATVSVSPTLGGDVISTTLVPGASNWSHGWLSVETLGTQQVVVKVDVNAGGTGGAMYFDELTLGKTMPGKYSSFLPLLLR
jgi:hypothetical protein